jgi:hypothetical protein
MKPAIWKFTIAHYPNEHGPNAIGITLGSGDEVEEFGSMLGIDVPGKGLSNPVRHLNIQLEETDPRLELLAKTIRERYGWNPSEWFIVPEHLRNSYYGIEKKRLYAERDFDNAPFLLLHFAAKAIAKHKDGTEDQVAREVYVAKVDELQSNDVQFGMLTPFHGLCVTEALGRQLQDAGIRGLSLDPVAFVPSNKVRKPLLKLSSKVIAPHSLLPLVDELGRQIEPNTSWECYFDDRGYQPIEFKYRKSDLGLFESADILVSYERTGVTKARAYRWCLVSQRFRKVMKELKVAGVQYAPVRFVE